MEPGDRKSIIECNLDGFYETNLTQGQNESILSNSESAELVKECRRKYWLPLFHQTGLSDFNAGITEKRLSSDEIRHSQRPFRYVVYTLICSQPHPDIGDNEMRLVSTQSDNAPEANIVCQRNGKCKWCGSDKVVKAGLNPKKQQMFKCKECHHRFIDNGALPRMRTPTKVIAAAMELWMDGLSDRKVKRNLKKLFGVVRNQDSIHDWLVKYSKISVDFVKCFQTHTSEKWHADETALNIKGVHHWYWFVMEHDTRFILSSNLTEWGRTDQHAIQLFKDAKSMASYRPKIIITDKLPAYRSGVTKNFFHNKLPRDTRHINKITFVKEFNNNMIERSNGVIKDRLKPMRGLKSVESARILLDGFNLIHRNFLTEHSAIGMTPAKACHIDLPIEDGWEDMIKWATNWQSIKKSNS